MVQPFNAGSQGRSISLCSRHSSRDKVLRAKPSPLLPHSAVIIKGRSSVVTVIFNLN